MFIIYTYSLNMNNPDVLTGVDANMPFNMKKYEPTLALERTIDPKIDMTMVLPKLAGLPDGYHTQETIHPYITNKHVYDTARHYENLQYRNNGNTQTSPPDVSRTNVGELRKIFEGTPPPSGGKRARRSRKSRKSRKARKSRKMRKFRKVHKSRRHARR